MIDFQYFSQVELKIAKIIEAVPVENSEKLIKLLVDLGGEKRQIVAGIGKSYSTENLIGKEITIVANLEPRIFMGVESQGMLLAVSSPAGPILLSPETEVPPGSLVK